MSFAYFDWIAHHAEVRGDKTALIDLATQRRLTYRALDERVDRLATHLASLGVVNGARVAVLAPNTTDILEVQFACFRLAAIFVPLNIRLTVHELQFILGDAAPTVLVHDHEFGEMARDLQKRCGIAHRTLLDHQRIFGLGHGLAYFYVCECGAPGIASNRVPGIVARRVRCGHERVPGPVSERPCRAPARTGRRDQEP